MQDSQMISLDTEKYLSKIAKILYLLTVCVITVTGFFNRDNLYEVLKLNLLSVVLVSILIFYAKENKVKFVDNTINLFIVIGSFLFSLICIMISIRYNLYNLWLVGPMVIAMLIDTNFGLSFHLLFSFLLSVAEGYNIDNLMFNFILGALGCILAKYIKDLTKIGYSLIIFLSSNITLIFIINNFMIKKTININVLYSLLSSILLYVIAYITFIIYQKNFQKHQEPYSTNTLVSLAKEELLNTNLEASKTEDKQYMDAELQTNTDTNLKLESYKDSYANLEDHNLNKVTNFEEGTLDVILNDDYILLNKLRGFSEKLYYRSKEIGEISYMAALKIHANSKLAKAGGLYCKIGRTISKDYIAEGVKILEENDFPEEVIHIVKQHNLKYGNPKTKEAAIVMLTDNIIASLDAMKKSQNNKLIPMNKLIDGIFTLRLTKSNLDESGLAITDLKILKEFFHEEFSKNNII